MKPSNCALPGTEKPPWIPFSRASWLESGPGKLLALIAFSVLAIILFWQGLQRPPKEPGNPEPPPPSKTDTRIASS